MTNLSKHHPFLTDKLEAVLLKHNITRQEAEQIMDDVDLGLSERKLGYFRKSVQNASFFEKPLKRRVQIIIEALVTATAMAALVAVFVWKLLN